MLNLISIVGLAPHPPIIIPEIGRGEIKKVSKTVEGMKVLSSRIRDASPDLLIIITPHGQIMREGPAILDMDELIGDFGQFGYSGIQLKMRTDRELIELIKEESMPGGPKPVLISDKDYLLRSGKVLDHGAMVPLYYLQQEGLDLPGLHVTIGFQPLNELYRFGSNLAGVLEKRGGRAAVVASGDLSHRLIPGAPAGFNERGAEFDRTIVNLLQESRVEDILNLDQDLIEQAGECGLRPFAIALGMLEGEKINSDIISYEGPFGVGYLVASINATV